MKRLLPLLALLVAGCRTPVRSLSASPGERMDALAAAVFAAPDETVVLDEWFFDRPAREGYPAIVFSVVRGQRAPVALTRASDRPDGTLGIDLAEGSPLARRLEAAQPLDPERKREALLAIRADALALADDPGSGAVRRTFRDWLLYGSGDPGRGHDACTVLFVESDEPPRIVVRQLRSVRSQGHVIRVPAASLAAHDIARDVARAAPWNWADGASIPGSGALVAGQSGVRQWDRALPFERGEDGVLRAPSAIRFLKEHILSRIALARKSPPDVPALRVETVPAPPPDGPDERLSFELGASFVELPGSSADGLGLEWILVESYERVDKAPEGAVVRHSCWPGGAPDPGVPVRHGGDADHAGYAILSPPEMTVLREAFARCAESCVEGWTEVREGDLVRFAAPSVALDVSVRKPGGRRGLAIEPALAVELDAAAPLAAPPRMDPGLYSGSTVAVFLPGSDERPVRLLFLSVREIDGEPAYSLDAVPAAPADFAGLARLLAAEVRADSPPGEDAAGLRDDLFPLAPVEPAAPLEDADWKRIFAACGVDWPDGSFVHQMVRAHANFLTVRNTESNLRHVRRVLDALGDNQSRAARLLDTLGPADDKPHAESAEKAEPNSHAGSAQ